MVTSTHVSANLRILDLQRRGVRTFSGVRQTLAQDRVSNFLNAISSLRAVPTPNALHTVRAELKDV